MCYAREKKLFFVWFLGHSGIKGNKLEDRTARSGCLGSGAPKKHFQTTIYCGFQTTSRSQYHYPKQRASENGYNHFKNKIWDSL